MEIWKDVVGYEGIYEISNFGRIRTAAGKTTINKNKVKRQWKQRILKEKNPRGREVRITLWKDGKKKDFLVHRLVAFAFIPKITGKDFINHKDGNPKNNHVDNLEWCTVAENNNHAFENNLIQTGMAVRLISPIGIEYEFRSRARACKFLGRKHTYISSCLKHNRPIKNIKGEVFEVIVL